MASEPGVHLHFGISAGVRFGQGERKKELQTLLAEERRRHPRPFSANTAFPLVDERGALI